MRYEGQFYFFKWNDSQFKDEFNNKSFKVIKNSLKKNEVSSQ